jgi:hypothetical protein
MRALKKFGKVGGAFLVFLALALCVFLIFVQPWDRQWGARSAETARFLPGDDLVSRPNYVTTRGITIQADPADVWPWLVQMGYRRGGLYSYDTLDRLAGILDARSADSIKPEFQSLNAGDVIPLGSGPNWPVASMEKERSLVLDIKDKGSRVSWSFDLRPLNASSCRLVLRVRSRLKTGSLTAPLLNVLDIVEFPMVERMLTGIRDRAEGHPRDPNSELVELGSWGLTILVGLAAAITAFFRRRWLVFFWISCAAFVAVIAMAFVQPGVLVCAIVAVALMIWLLAAFGGRRKTGIF